VGLKVRWHDRAARDFRSIHAHLVQESGAPAAKRVRAELRQSARRLPYRIYYTVTAVAVVILHIRHSSRLGPDLGGLGH
jgi:plasmid stabilization system protein ParE